MAGKSTLVKALAGALKPDSGQIEFEGKEVRLENPRDAENRYWVFASGSRAPLIL
ncbi:MAG: hypothetical protein CM15mP45_17300 [Deltaproteobacteria bacterium]|nr:MAG: hypothetical protein CM15mP45_17300 [Deltaproteobacteria bacterium]